MQALVELQLQFISSQENVAKMDWNHFGRGLGGLRREYGLLQKQVAGESGFTPSYIAALEGGRRPPPPVEALKKIIKAIGASAQEEERLIRASKLTDIARVMANYSDDFPGAAAAISLLEVSSEMTPIEVDALRTLVEGYRFRTLLPRRSDM